MTGSQVRLPLAEIEALTRRLFLANGVSAESAAILAAIIASAERDGPRSHGLAMLPRYVSSLRCGWIDGRGEASWSQPAAGLLRADGNNGFAQVVIRQGHERLAALARSQGIASLGLRNAHHIGPLRADVEPLAEAGLIAIAMSNSRPFLVPWQGTRSLFGTNPMAFACPRDGAPPLVWDQASSVMAISDVRLAAAEGRTLDRPAGLGPDGRPSSDPEAVLESGRLLPFGDHKGASIALLVEILAGALGGGHLAIEDRSAAVPGAMSSNAGQILIAIDPAVAHGPGFTGRIATLLAAFADNGEARIPGDGRLARRVEAERDGVLVAADLVDHLEALTVSPSDPDGDGQA